MKMLRYEDVESLRECLSTDVERLDEGLFDRFKNFLSRKLGGDIAKADRLISMYSQAKQTNLLEIGKIRAGVMAAKAKAEKDPKAAPAANEQAARAEEAIARINKAASDKLAAVEKQIQVLIKNKPERLRTYIDAKKAEVDWVSAQRELEAAKKYASDEEIEKLKDQVESEGKIAKNYQDKLALDTQDGAKQSKEDLEIKAEREKLSKLRQSATN